MTIVRKKEVDLLVLGAGWSGLLTAFLYAQKENGSVLVLEKDAVAGGLARTIDVQGFKADIGGHALFFKKAENIAFLKELLSEDMLLLKRKETRIYINGQYLHYPANFDFIWKLNKKYIFHILWDLLKCRKVGQIRNFEDWVRAHYGDTLYKLVFQEYSQKVWGQPCRQLSHGWADMRIGKNSLPGFILKHFLEDTGVKEKGRAFYYPRRGMEALVKALLSRMGTGFQMTTNVQLQSFFGEGGRLMSLQYSAQGETHDVRFKRVVSTIPLTELVPVLSDPPAGIAQEAVRGIRYRSLIIVYLLVDKPLISDWSWCYYPSDKLIFSRIHEPKFWSKDLAPQGKTLLSVEIFCDYQDPYWEMKDDMIVVEVRKALKDVRLLSGEEGTMAAEVHRIKHAYPLMFCGFEASLGVVTQGLQKYTNLYLAGRSGTHSYFDMEECLEDVKKTVQQMTCSGPGDRSDRDVERRV